jgi:maltose-binding protein MalE
MRRTLTLTIEVCLVLIAAGLFSACRRAQSPEIPSETISQTPNPTVVGTATSVAHLLPSQTPSSTYRTAPTQQLYPVPGSQTETAPLETPYISPLEAVSSPTQPATFTLTAVQSSILATTMTATASATVTASNTAASGYPGPENSPALTSNYPGPEGTSTTPSYPGPATYAPSPTFPSSGSATPPTPRPGTTAPVLSPAPTSGTPGVIPTELPPKPPLSPPPPGSNVTIWHSWNTSETAVLQSIIQSFQRIYADVTFSLRYVPLDDLYATYEEAAYLGNGPGLLLGPAEWGPGLFEGELVADLRPYVPQDYLSSINSAALASGEYYESLISLPLSQHGMVMFRNIGIIDTAPIAFTELDESSKAVTHAGIVGSYLERGSQFSAADIIGLGGKLMTENGYPAFNDDYGLEWFELLADYDEAGAVTFNTNWDLEMFKRGRVGTIIDGTWNIVLLSNIIGKENLAIDPWPTYGTGHMSGWVESDSVFLNANTNGNDQFAALSFIGYLLDPNVQMRLAEVGHIPSVTGTQPRDPLIKQAMAAFSLGTAFPITIDDDILKIYQKELDKAISSVFVSGISTGDALQTASDNITLQLDKLKSTP